MHIWKVIVTSTDALSACLTERLAKVKTWACVFDCVKEGQNPKDLTVSFVRSFSSHSE